MILLHDEGCDEKLNFAGKSDKGLVRRTNQDCFAVERLSDGELLGFTGLHRVTFSGGLEGQVEILWRLRHDAWGQGYATEAARACIAHAAKLGIPELVAFTFVGNGRSRRVMQKLGMTCVGEFDHPALPEGHPLRRHALYRIRTEQ